MHESQMHEKNCFLTLTYSDQTLPSDGSLRPQDFQLFMKRLRRGSSAPLRFFHCGEYGETTARPHYHAIIFGEDFSSDRTHFRKTQRGDTLYNSQRLSETWGLGHAVIGDLTFESAAYVARYCLKKVTGDAAETHYNGRKPEYITMSRGGRKQGPGGIGKSWYDQFNPEVLRSDTVVMRGQEMLPPPYYDKLLEKADPALYKKVKRARSAAAESFAGSEDATTRRLLDRGIVKEQTVKQTLRREL